MGFDEQKVSETNVTKTFNRIIDSYLAIELENGKILKVTHNHPFYIKRHWVEAKDLKIGDELYHVTNSDKTRLRMQISNPMFNPETIKKSLMNTDYNLISQKLKGHIVSKETLQKMKNTCLERGVYQKISQKMKRNNPMKNPDTIKKVMSNPNMIKYHQSGGGYAIRWSKTGEKEKQRQKMIKNNPMFDSVLAHQTSLKRSKKLKLRPTRLEKHFMQLIDNPSIKYVGDFKYWVTDSENSKNRKNPDFIVEPFAETKKVIEIADIKSIGYQKTENYEKDIINFYKLNGIKCLVIWFNSKKLKLTDNKKLEIIEKVENFIHNGRKIIKITEIAEKTKVYNLSCSPYENYFVDSKESNKMEGYLVHNCMRQSFNPPKGTMTLEIVQNLLKRMPYISVVTIQGLCEPYLNPEAPKIIKWLHDEGYFVSLTTNGTIPLVGERLDCLRYVDDFVISIDTNDPETFELLRNGAKYEEVIKNLQRVVQMKRDRNLTVHDNPPMHINAVITTENLNQIENFVHMLEEYKDQITYIMVDPVSRPDYCTFEDPLALKSSDQKFQSWISSFKGFAKNKSKISIVGLDYMLQPSYNWKDCPMASMNLWVEPNGDVYECYGFDYVLGNVFKDSALVVFNSKKSREFRKKLLTSHPPLDQCHSCNFARSGWQIHGGYLARSRQLSVPKPMTIYEALKHVLSVISRKRKHTF